MKLKFEKLLTAGFAAALGASLIAATPADANQTISVKTRDRKTFTVNAENVKCVEGNTGPSMVLCSAYGVLTDLVGEKRQLSLERQICRNNYGSWSEDKLACSVARILKTPVGPCEGVFCGIEDFMNNDKPIPIP